MRYLYIIVILFTTSFSYAQTKYAADQYFKKYSYVKSAELYEKIYEKGDHSELVVSRLGDAYYFNNKYDQAEKWYKELFSTTEAADVSSEHYYRYIQVLKSLGKYNEADKFLSISEKENKNLNLKAIKDFYKVDENKKYDVKNLDINTKYSDYNNALIDNKLLFSSTRPKDSLRKHKTYGWNKQPYYGMYTADQKEESNSLSNVTSLKGKVNGRYHDASPVITKDGQVIYFTRDNSKGRSIRVDGQKTSNLKIYKAELKDNEWKCVKELPFNHKSYSVGQPSLSTDEKYLYFVSDMPGGFGLTDLYKVAINDDGTYGIPENLGEKINTSGKEMFPYISKNNKLYFSSNGHVGLGGLDVFESEMKEGVYQAPVNLKAPINSKSDDFSFIVTNDEKGYFSSNRVGGKGDDDIYAFNLVKVKEESVVCIKQIRGFVYDELTKKVLPDAQVQLTDISGKIIKTITSDAKGFYDLGSVDCVNSEYKIAVTKEAYNSDALSFAINSGTPTIVELEAYLLQKEIKINTNNFDVHINPIYFDFDKFNIRSDAAKELDKVVKVMKDFPEIKLRIESHTDARGNDAYNEQLSDNRAKSSSNYIISQGVAKERILSAKGFGEYKLLNKCSNGVPCSVKEHQLNRRSYFYISNNPGHIKVKNQVGE